MSLTFEHLIEEHARTQAQKIAIKGDQHSISYRQLVDEVLTLSGLFQGNDTHRIAIMLPNSPAWIALDLAAIKAQRTFVAVPHFFSPSQIKHLIHDADIDTLIYDAQLGPSMAAQFKLEATEQIDCLGNTLCIAKRAPLAEHRNDHNEQSSRTKAREAAKISYTSGTTGEPKGVLIAFDSINNTVAALLKTIHSSHAERHLNLLPFSLLLENIVGVYAVLASGGCCYTPSPSSLGMHGSSSVEWQKFTNVIQATQPSSMITVPALLQGLIHCVEHFALDTASFKTIAVGGAPISTTVLKRAQSMGLPVFQGYGMTECGSVVCLNTPEHNKIGSVGKPLPHVTVRIDDQGEVIIGGLDFLGYTHQKISTQAGEWPTGDLGYLDEQGFLTITARRSSTYSTAYGRNIAPEWLESELDGEAVIAQSVVFGESQKTNIAIIVPVAQGIEDALIGDSIARANQRLPDYARISNWTRASDAFEVANGQRRASGTLNRSQIYADYQPTIQALFIGNQS